MDAPTVDPETRPRGLTGLARWVGERAGRVALTSLAVALIAGWYGASAAGDLTVDGFNVETSESSRAAAWIDEEFAAGSFDLVLVVTALGGDVGTPDAHAAGTALTDDARASEHVTEVLSWFELDAPPLRSEDGSTALVLLALDGDRDEQVELVAELTPRLQRTTDVIDVRVGGYAEAFRQITDQSEADLLRAELIVVPLTAVLLVLVFRSLFAALLPLLVGGIAVAGTTAALRMLGQVTDVSVYALNMATALGLGLGIDYSLFIVQRFREELADGWSVPAAIERTNATAGRTVLFSAFAVAASLAALLVFPLAFLRSFAYAGTIVVVLAASVAVVTLPAVLHLLGRNVDRISVGNRTMVRVKDATTGRWHDTALAVMRRPLVVGATVTTALVLLAVPFGRLELGLGDDRVLPEGHPGRVANDIVRERFSTAEAFPVVIAAPGLDATSDEAAALAAEVSTISGVSRVDAATGVWILGGLAVEDAGLSARHRGDGGTWFNVVTGVEPYSAASERIVGEIRGLEHDAVLQVGGLGAELVDTKAALTQRLPVAAVLLTVITSVVLFLVFGSVLVPVKAILLNLLSLTATFGAMVWVFQDGNLAGVLGFTPTGRIMLAMPVLMFAIAFGLSMDYEVFLLARIKEEHDHGRTNTEAVAVGLQRTGPLISAAALLLASVFVAFTASSVALMKLFGLGLALAVILDATVVRALLVPSFMGLAGEANWWAPAPLRRLHDRFGISEAGGTDRSAGLEGAPLVLPSEHPSLLPRRDDPVQFVRPTLAGATVVLVVALVTVAVRSGPDGVDVDPVAQPTATATASTPDVPTPTTTGVDTTRTTTSSAPATAVTTPPSAGTSTGPAADPTTPSTTTAPADPTAAPSPTPTTSPAPAEPTPSASPPPSDEATIAPTAAGTYVYDTDGSTRLNGGDETRLPEETSLEVPPADADGRQRAVRDLRDEGGNGNVTTTTTRTTGDEVLLESVTIRGSYGGITQTVTMTATSTFALATTSARAGDVTTGRLEGDGSTADITVEVLARDDATSSVRITTVLSGDLEGQQVSLLEVRTSDLLTLSEDVDSDVRSGFVRIETQYRAVLQS